MSSYAKTFYTPLPDYSFWGLIPIILRLFSLPSKAFYNLDTTCFSKSISHYASHKHSNPAKLIFYFLPPSLSVPGRMPFPWSLNTSITLMLEAIKNPYKKSNFFSLYNSHSAYFIFPSHVYVSLALLGNRSYSPARQKAGCIITIRQSNIFCIAQWADTQPFVE